MRDNLTLVGAALLLTIICSLHFYKAGKEKGELNLLLAEEVGYEKGKHAALDTVAKILDKTVALDSCEATLLTLQYDSNKVYHYLLTPKTIK